MKIVVSSLINSDTMLQNRQWCITVNNANGFCIFSNTRGTISFSKIDFRVQHRFRLDILCKNFIVNNYVVQSKCNQVSGT